MRYFCRLFLVIGFALVIHSAKGQTCPSYIDTIIVCPKDTPSYVLGPTSAGTVSNYLWSTGETTSSITIRNKGRYWVSFPGTTCPADTIVVGVWGEGNKGNYQWYFGNKTGLNFMGGTTPTLIKSSLLVANGATSVISDPTGHILLYTDGNTIYNSNNGIITSSLGGNTNLAQSSVIIPSQNENNVYTVFTVGSSGLQYDTVDMSKNGGLGAATANTALNSTVSNDLASVYDSSGGFWVATDDGSNLLAYHVTNSGVSSTPVSSPDGAGGLGSFIKFSENGEKAALAVPGSNEVLVYNFDKKTGIFTISDTLKNITNPYAVEFSQDGKKVYVTTGSSGNIYGYDLTQTTSALVDSSQYSLTNNHSIGYYGLQVAPNGEIYVATDNGYLASIGSPQADSSGVNFLNKAISLNGVNTVSLPNLVSNYFTSSSLTIEYSGGCAGTVTKFLGIAPDSVRSWAWTITPPGTTTTHVSSSKADSISTTFTYGTYIIKAAVTYQCENHLETKDTSGEVVIYQAPTPHLVSDTLCNVPSLTLNAGKYYAGSAALGSSPISYSWTNKADSLLGTDSTLVVDTTGTYYVIVNNNSCAAIDSATITFINPPPISLGNNATFCVGQTDVVGVPATSDWTVSWSGAGTVFNVDSIQVTSPGGQSKVTLTSTVDPSCIVKDSVTTTFIPVPIVSLGPDLTECTGATETLDAQNPGFKYLWSNTDTTEDITVKTAGTYYVKVYKDFCYASDTITINYETYPVINLPAEETFCSRNGATITLYGGVAASYSWLPNGETTDSIKVDTSGTFTLQAYSAIAHCKSTATVEVKDVCLPQIFVPAAFSPNGDGKNDVFQIFGNNILTYDMRVFDKWGELIFVSADLSTSWDGTYRSQPVEQGVYTWKITYTGQTQNGTSSKVQEGNVTVLK